MPLRLVCGAVVCALIETVYTGVWRQHSVSKAYVGWLSELLSNAASTTVCFDPFQVKEVFYATTAPMWAYALHQLLRLVRAVERQSGVPALQEVNPTGKWPRTTGDVPEESLGDS
jgi:hypothetical protein